MESLERLEQHLTENHEKLIAIVDKHERAIFGNNGELGALTKLELITQNQGVIATELKNQSATLVRIFWALAAGAIGVIGTLALFIFKLLWEKN